MSTLPEISLDISVAIHTFRFMKSRFFFVYVFLVSITSLAARADQIYFWDFTQSNIDQIRGVEATLANPSARDANGYTFTDTGEGITILQPAGVAVTGTYRIEIVFSLDAVLVDEYQRIIDFADKANDEGLYAYDDYFFFFNYGEIDLGIPTFSGGQEVTLVITRDARSKVVTLTLNGLPGWSFVDSDDFGVFSAANGVMRFFEDDGASGEHPAGTVKSIRVSNPDLSRARAIAAAQAKCAKAKKQFKKAKKSKKKTKIKRAKKKLKKCQQELRALLAS